MKIKRITLLALGALMFVGCGKDPVEKPGDGDSDAVGTFTSKIYAQDSDGYPFFRIPAMVTTKMGTILCFCEARESINDNGNIDIVVKRSEDHGKSWGKIITIADAGSDRYGNPVPVALDDGRVMIVYGWCLAESSTSTKVFYQISDDEGLTWGPQVEITSQIKIPTRSKYQTGPVHGIVKQRDPHKGRIVIPVYGTSTNGQPSGVFYSDDNGKTWRPGGSMDYKLAGEPTIAERGDGSIVINVRDNNKEDLYRYQSISTDGGDNWSSPLATPIIEPGCQAALLTYDLGTSASNTVLLYSGPTNTESRRHGAVKISTNGGLDWKYEYMYTSLSGESMYSAYSDLCIVADDIIGVAFEYGRNYSMGIQFKSFKKEKIKEVYTGKNKS